MRPVLIAGVALALAAGCHETAVSAPPPRPLGAIASDSGTPDGPIAREAKVPKATEDGFRLQGELGKLDQKQIEAAFNGRQGEIDACFRKGLAGHPYLGGTLELKVRVEKAGAVKSVWVLRPLGNLETEACVVGVASGLRFPPPQGNADAEFTYSLDFRGRMSLQDWGSEAVANAFATHRSALDACARPGSAGGVPRSLRITFFVTPGGSAPSAGVGADTALPPGYAVCVAREVMRWRFSDPRGKVARATYEF